MHTFLFSNLSLYSLYTDNNLLSGSLSENLCNIVNQPNSVLNVVQPSNNPLLCGQVPQCLYGNYLNPLHVVGTHLIYPPAQDSDTRVSGYCSNTAPVCEKEGGCYVEAPDVIASLTTFDFRFTNFTDPIGMRSYSCCIGTEAGALVLKRACTMLKHWFRIPFTRTNTHQPAGEAILAPSLLNTATYAAHRWEHGWCWNSS